MMRLLKMFIVLGLVVVGAWWYFDDAIDLKQSVSSYIENGDVATLEARYPPEKIMEANRQELLGSGGRTFLEPVLKYAPYLLMEVKYLQDGKSKEGTILWGMQDGEMVLNGETWETTHGFEDCINAGASVNDFKVINTIAKSRGSLSKDDLQSTLSLEPETAQLWIDSTRQKHLIVQKGNLLQLHFEDPKVFVIPQTKMKQTLVAKNASRAQKIVARYSKSKIMKTAQAAFGGDFTIRAEKEVYLPIYTLEVQNPDGSIRRSDWNALTGQPFLSKMF
jgi:hypothetical protein